MRHQICPLGDSTGEARKEARRFGWTYEHHRDLCPACRTHPPQPVAPEPLAEGERVVHISDLLAAPSAPEGDDPR